MTMQLHFKVYVICCLRKFASVLQVSRCSQFPKVLFCHHYFHGDPRWECSKRSHSVGAAFQGANFIHFCYVSACACYQGCAGWLWELMTPVGAGSSLAGGCKFVGGQWRTEKETTCNSCFNDRLFFVCRLVFFSPERTGGRFLLLNISCFL